MAVTAMKRRSAMSSRSLLRVYLHSESVSLRLRRNRELLRPPSKYIQSVGRESVFSYLTMNCRDDTEPSQHCLQLVCEDFRGGCNVQVFLSGLPNDAPVSEPHPFYQLHLLFFTGKENPIRKGFVRSPSSEIGEEQHCKRQSESHIDDVIGQLLAMRFFAEIPAEEPPSILD